MNIYRILNIINEIALFLFIPVLLVDYNAIAFGEDRNGSMVTVCLILFFTTFICGFIILFAAGKKEVNNSFSLAELGYINKTELLFVLAAYIISVFFFIKNIKTDIFIIYFAVSSIATVFVLGENIAVQKIGFSPCYRINIPWVIYPLPFLFFISAEMYVSEHSPEKYEDAAGIAVFILSGLMLMFCAWHSYCTVNTELGTVERNDGILALFRGSQRAVLLDKVDYLEDRGMYFIIYEGDISLKINKLYSNAGKLKCYLISQGVEVR